MRVFEVRVYPIKSLCPVLVASVPANLEQGLEHDREWALLDSQGFYVNGKHCPAVHRVRLLSFQAPDTVTLQHLAIGAKEASKPVSFRLSQEKKEAEKWFTEVLQKPVRLVRKAAIDSGFTDDPRFDGPTIVSKATLETLEAWFEIDDAVGRFRPNIVVEGVPAFWEDTLITEDPATSFPITIGGAEVAAVYPVHRCVVPTRASSSSVSRPPGSPMSDFIQRFQKLRTDNLPKGAPVKRLTTSPHKGQESYHLCTACSIIKSGVISVGDLVVVKDKPVLLQEALLATKPLSKRSLRRLVNGAYSLRELSKTTSWIITVIIAIFPLALTAKLITHPLPHSVRKPSSTELATGFLWLFLVIGSLWTVVNWIV